MAPGVTNEQRQPTALPPQQLQLGGHVARAVTQLVARADQTAGLQKHGLGARRVPTLCRRQFVCEWVRMAWSQLQ